jgi:hypothetical protein
LHFTIFTMPNIRLLFLALLTGALLVPPAMGQSKAAIGKSAAEFQQLSQGLAASLSELGKRSATASPNDRDMLKLVNSQLSLVDATADGVLALGLVAAEVRDTSDLAIVKKQLASRCNALKSLTDATAKYVSSLSANIAAVAVVAEVSKSHGLLGRMGQHALCNPTPGKP